MALITAAEAEALRTARPESQIILEDVISEYIRKEASRGMSETLIHFTPSTDAVMNDVIQGLETAGYTVTKVYGGGLKIEW